MDAWLDIVLCQLYIHTYIHAYISREKIVVYCRSFYYFPLYLVSVLLCTYFLLVNVDADGSQLTNFSLLAF